LPEELLGVRDERALPEIRVLLFERHIDAGCVARS
jgi:hypothetical protein